MIRRAMVVGVLFLMACGRSEQVNVEQDPGTPDEKVASGRGERVIGVMGSELGGCPWSADVDSKGRVVTLAAAQAESKLNLFSTDEGLVTSKSLARPFSVVSSVLGTDEVQAAQWWEDAKTGAYGWRSAYLSPEGDVVREEERGKDPFDRLSLREDGAILVMPHGGHYLQLQASPTATPVQFFNARDLGYTMHAARFVPHERVVSVGISVHPLETPIGVIGSEGRFVAVVMTNLKGEILWARDLGIALPENSEIQLNVEMGDDLAFVTGGNTWNNNEARIHVESFLSAFELDGRERFRKSFENADAPWMVAIGNSPRVILPKKAASLDWYQRSLVHEIFDPNGALVHESLLRPEGEDGVVVKRLLKANGEPVVVGCFWGQARVGDQQLTGNGDSGFVYGLDTRIEK